MCEKITSLSQFMEHVEAFPSDFSLSRGQSKDYELLPSALRLDLGTRKYSKRAVNCFLNNFKINSHQYMTSPWDVKNEIEWMLHAQHYGIPTRLMDFTSSHITSLLFAVEKAFSDADETDAVVYFLNPEALNNNNIQQSKIITEYDNSNFNESDGPIVIKARKINPRVNAQHGVFVLFQDDDKPLETTEGILIKLVIDGSKKKNILSSLHSIGINFTHIYPELSSVAKDIVIQQDIRDFLREDI
ncbi:FRG domain-containing protein [Shewanella gelidimarina]|uniref:FRG domain-containing protein n=1 Tax=Shewanella gelidimarina TaxID=56813 RepID=UPI00200C6A7B|nr:FRG domain-containing protein [Shewanella gelidimarina]MCL1056803.1 FRG domain-containing protein [Shewanella gelidimarina]